MNKNLLLIAAFAFSFCVTSCKKQPDIASDKIIPDGLKAAPDGFDYSSTKKIDVNVRLISSTDKPMKSVLVSVYHPSNLKKGSELTKVMSDNNGYIKTTLTVPSFMDTLVVDPAYFGLMRNVKLYAKNNTVSAIIGGQSGASGNVVIERTNTAKPSRKNKLSAKKGILNAGGSTVFAYDANDYDDLGRPKDLYPKDDIDWDELKARINNSLPESHYVKSKYISTESPSNLTITKLSDVWITFVHEGADYRNSFGYYTYPTGHPPLSENDIDTVHMIFPNASLAGHTGTGSMRMGDKVKIGRFPAGVSLGFVLLQNAYTDKTFSTSATKFYSNEDLNPENAKLKRHNVLLNNAPQKTFLIGFEDIDRREGYGSDQDFNDLVVYAQSNPVEAISPLDIPFLDEKIEDRDGDGISDDLDEYPDDKKRAYDRYYPSQSIWGTTAFEDLWPNEGDYDLNDLVISYRYKFAMSSSNGVVDLTAEFKPLAAGASMQNGFGLELPIQPSAISSVSGYNLSSGYIKLDGNGVEAGQAKAVVIPFDNHRAVFGGTAGFVNTLSGAPTINGQHITLSIQFSSPLSEEFTTTAPFNPFMISNLDRGKEVHLVNHEPTSLANLNLLGTGSDNSSPDKARYYLTETNRPFALDIYGTFVYPKEHTSITLAYMNFVEWALSGGTKYTNWYDISVKGNTNESLLFISK
ncbi:LruC domain-containing protein [Pedobacter psychroterrae]|uniref:LruC domain-containing protein n=1 Tax=Pedobacter psychroterrae TaxID=2530453 RepID=A0A4R0NLJ3_9SPHI|nr:LruC domain-containing protein [Pedobacter psychroterrae]TCD01702.1 LruC domain-containing protein [Pedobacter psychroterrae]